MRPVRALGLYILVVFPGGALLAPWLYWLAQGGDKHYPHLAAFLHVTGAPFHRFVDRSLLVLALVGLWPLLRALGATSWREVGLVRLAGQWHRLLTGFLLGFVSLALVASLALAAGGRDLNHPLAAARIAKSLFSAAGTAVVVAMLEEILFRGGLFGGLRRVFEWRFALGVSSLIYALVHFLTRTQDPPVVRWTSGLDQLGMMLGGFANWHQMVPGFFSLTLAGLLLGLAYQRTANLYFSIGLHGGWIFWLKTYGALTARNPDARSWLWGTGRMIDGWLALGVLLFTFLLLLARLPAERKGISSA